MTTKAFKNIFFSAAAAGACLTASLHAEMYDQYGQYKYMADENVDKENQKDSKITIQNGEVSNADILQHLDKEGRAIYLGLDSEGQKIARQMAASALRSNPTKIDQNFKEAVSAARKQQQEKIQNKQDEMLHNGMNRLQQTKNSLHN